MSLKFIEIYKLTEQSKNSGKHISFSFSMKYFASSNTSNIIYVKKRLKQTLIFHLNSVQTQHMLRKLCKFSDVIIPAFNTILYCPHVFSLITKIILILQHFKKFKVRYLDLYIH